MNMLRSVLRTIVGVLSVLSFLAIWTQPIDGKTVAAFVLLAILIAFYRPRKAMFPELCKADSKYLAWSAVLCVLVGVLYFFHFSAAHGHLSQLSRNVVLLLMIAMACATVLAIPATASFAKGLICASDCNDESDSPQHRGFLSNPFAIGMVVAIVGIVVMLVFSFSHDIWVDEAFSLSLIRHSYSEVISLTAADVHPPLYYIILKAVVDGVGSILPAVPPVFVAKLTSVIPYIICVLVFAFKVRRDWGDYVAGMGAACVVCMFPLIGYVTEIRMYGWGMLFVTLAFLYACDILKKNKRLSWVLFYVFSLCAFYTHYFAGVAIGLLFLVLLLHTWLNDRKRVKYVLLAAVLIIIGYLPWLRVLLSQLQTVSESYWIPAITPVIVCVDLYYIFVNALFAGIALLLVAVVYKKLRHDTLCREGMVCSYTGVLVPLWTIAVGLAVSLCVRPVFMSRYAVPGIVSLWLGVLWMAQSIGSRHIKRVLSMLVVATCIAGILSFVHAEGVARIEANKSMDFLASNRDAVYIGGGANGSDGTSHCMRVIAYLSGSKTYIWKYDTSELSLKVFGNVESVPSVERIKDILRAEENTYLAVQKDETLCDSLRASGVECTYAGTYSFEGRVDLYKLCNED